MLENFNPLWIIIFLTILSVLGGAIFGFGKWYGAVNNDRDSLREFMDEIRGDIKKICAHLPSPSPVASESPVQLTEFGRKISDNVSALQWAKDHAENLKKEAKDKEEFQIFELCIE